MTEAEYVSTIKAVAERYKLVFRDDTGKVPLTDFDAKAMRHWQAVKEKLSPSTAIALCEAWLAKESE
jgi:hypothetical protein